MLTLSAPNSITAPGRFARARTDDPDTSHEAALSVEGLTQKQAAVLWVFKKKGPITHEELQGFYQWYEGLNMLPRQSASGVRTRAHELAELGKIIDTGERRNTICRRKAIVWRHVEG